jgi:hypothetical protein
MIEPKYATLKTLFADRVFRIPHYQRFYSWQSKQRTDLFTDLETLADRGGDNHHFMATLVCFRTAELKPVGDTDYRVYDIVDGQQRLTTLILLLKCVELALEENSPDRAKLAEVIVKQDGNLILLQTNNANEHIFNAFLRDGQRPAKVAILTHADRNLAAAIDDCAGFVKRWKERRGDLMSLLRLVQNRLGFVIYDTEDSRTVYSLFEVLNSRGLAVDWLDKCKSELMGQAFELAGSDAAAAAAINTLQNIWGEIYRQIADLSVSGQEILRVTATLYYGAYQGKPRRADDSLEQIRKDCDHPDKPRRIAERLLDVTRKLVALEKNRFLGPVTRVLQARILAVALESTDCLNEKELQRALDQWERATFRIFGLYGRDARTKVGEYVRLAASIVAGEEGASRYSDIMEALRGLGDDYPIEDAMEHFSESWYDYPDECRYMLWRYEEHLARLAGKVATVDEQTRREIWQLRATDSIEHIFPQTPEPGGAWEGKMRDAAGNEKDPEDHVDRIGNLILLPMPLNAEAKNRGFSAKKAIYERHNLRMVQDVLAREDWTLAEIEERESRIAAWAVQAWDDLKSD